jgi:hypothetical protein
MLQASTRFCICAAAVIVLSIETGVFLPAQTPPDDPFEFLAPWIAVSKEDRARLDRDQVFARTLSGKAGQLAVVVATRLNADPDALAAWTRAIAELKRSKFVLAIARFSDPPSPSDLDGLTLDEHDLEAIRRCRPGACGLKLSAADIETLTAVVASAGVGWRDAVQQEFRRLLVERVIRYRAGGIAALSSPADRKKPRRPEDAVSAIVEQSPYLAKLPQVVSWLKEYPHADSGVESFFYWSKEHYGDGKSVISVTHVGIVRPESNHRHPAILVAGKQIFATHYLEGALGLTMVLHDATNGVRYLVYVNRSEVELLRGFFGRFVRSVLEDRVERQAPLIVRGLRARIESGTPPEEDADTGTSESRGSR